jgi:hypothetical protein
VSWRVGAEVGWVFSAACRDETLVGDRGCHWADAEAFSKGNVRRAARPECANFRRNGVAVRWPKADIAKRLIGSVGAIPPLQQTPVVPPAIEI